MSTFKKFEDIEAWKKARILTNRIYHITRNKEFAKDFSLRDQIRRASISIMLNIAEGFARQTDKEFSQFLMYAHGSTAEVQSALYIAVDQNYITEDIFTEIYSSAEDISRMLRKLSDYLTNKHEK